MLRRIFRKIEISGILSMGRNNCLQPTSERQNRSLTGRDEDNSTRFLWRRERNREEDEKGSDDVTIV